MTNREKYKDHLINIMLHHFSFGINSRTGRLFDCNESRECEHCRFHAGAYCPDERRIWLEQESDSDTSDIDWNSIPIDTLIRITTSSGAPMVRHFAGVIGGKVTYFADRRNSSDFKAIYPVRELDTVELEPDKEMQRKR